MRNRKCNGFTLIELLVVIGIIAILMGLLFSVGPGVLDRTKKVQAKNDLTQIVTAVNAFYTEYGRYPTTITTGDATYGLGTGANKSDALFNELRNSGGTINTRQIVFISPPEDKSQPTAKGKIGGDGQYYDPWGFAYSVRIDADYDNQVTNPYGDNQGAGPSPVRQGVIGWSVGKDNTLGKGGAFTGSDDVISWQ